MKHLLKTTKAKLDNRTVDLKEVKVGFENERKRVQELLGGQTELLVNLCYKTTEICHQKFFLLPNTGW